MHLAYLLAQEAEPAHEPNPILPAANELIWGTVAFLILLFLMYRTVFPSINQAFKDRRANIEASSSRPRGTRGGRAAAGAVPAAAGRRRGRDHADPGGGPRHRRAGPPRPAGQGRGRRRPRARRARQAIRAERDQAIRQLRNEVGTLAVELATRVVGDSLDRDRQLRLVDEYIEELGNQAQAGAMTSRREVRDACDSDGSGRRWR